MLDHHGQYRLAHSTIGDAVEVTPRLRVGTNVLRQPAITHGRQYSTGRDHLRRRGLRIIHDPLQAGSGVPRCAVLIHDQQSIQPLADVCSAPPTTGWIARLTRLPGSRAQVR